MSDIPPNNNKKLKEILEKAHRLYTAQTEIYCPYFGQKIALTSDGFNHLQNKPNRQPRTVDAQIRKLSLLKRALQIIPKVGTLQEYRDALVKDGNPDKGGFLKMKRIQYWGFHAILDDKSQKIKIIIRQAGDGKIVFWSVMNFSQKKLYQDDMEEE